MNIFDNKPVVTPTWELKLIVEMGTYLGETWVPDHTIAPYDFEVFFDGTKLELPTVLGTYQFNIPDTDDQIDHELKLVVIRSHWEHLIRCQVFVEDIDIGYIIENTGSYYTATGKLKHGTDVMGVEGYQIIPMQTPIYKWLLDNKKNVLSKLGAIK